MHDRGARIKRKAARIPRRWLRVGFALATTALLFVVVQRTRSSMPGLGRLPHPDLGWLALALLAELASLVAYALVVRELLGLGQVAARVRALLRATLGGIAMTASLPGGSALSAAYWYRQLRMEGAERTVAGVAMAGSMLAGALSLAGLFVVGVAVAGHAGPLAAFQIPILGAAGFVLASCVVFHRRLGRATRGLLVRVAPALATGHALHRRTILTIGTLAYGNWLLDCASLCAALAAMHADVPPQSIVLTYAIAQLVASLPLLPGGGGTVEVSLALGFAAFGHTSGNVIAGVLLFRMISCWGIVPVGWLAVALEGRRLPRMTTRRLPALPSAA
jgi:hypothetical protein